MSDFLTRSVDPISLQVFANLFSSVADEMGVALQRASFSPNVKMRLDFSCAIFDADGRLLAQAAHIPVHLGAMPMAMSTVRERFDLEPGDIVILNDPYDGGTHLPDVSLVSASFLPDGTRLGYVMSRAHHADVGGMSPGSMPLSTEIFQEGIIIPPILLVERGRLNDPVMDLIVRNVRTPDERRGDFSAQIAAQRVGESRLVSLAQTYGAGRLTAHGEALQEYSERMMRQLIERIEPGEYEYTDYLDDDGQGSTRIPISVVVRRARGSSHLEFDFAGSAVQCLGSVNAVSAVTTSATLYVMRCLQGDDVPVNGGSLAPLRFVLPVGLVVSATSPAAVAGGNVETSQRVVDVLFGALARALPDEVPAASQGTMNNLAIGGYDPHRARHFAYYETMGGGLGARPDGPGMNGVHDHMSNTLNTPAEVLESEFAVRVKEYSIRRGSGGAGRFAGGDGLRRDLEFLTTTTVTALAERRVLRPYGLHGGDPGATGDNVLIRANGVAAALPGKVTMTALPGDTLSIRSPGGGGFGSLLDPDKR